MCVTSFIKPKKYVDYVHRANTYDCLFLRIKAIEIMNIAIKQPYTKEEISSGLIYLGILYSKTKEYDKASDCYNNAFEIMKDVNFKYSSNFKKAIETFLHNGDKDRAEFWLNNLLRRQDYDKKCKRLTVLKRGIL